MAKGEMKNIVTMFFVLMMLVFAQAGDSPPPSSAPSASRVILCLGDCGLKCRPVLRIPEVYATCVAICGLKKCHKKPSKSAYDCTTSCALSKSIDANTDARGINAYVGSCLEACKDN